MPIPGSSQQRVSESILETIGKTPLIRLKRSVQSLAPAILAKVESPIREAAAKTESPST